MWNYIQALLSTNEKLVNLQTNMNTIFNMIYVHLREICLRYIIDNRDQVSNIRSINLFNIVVLKHHKGGI